MSHMDEATRREDKVKERTMAAVQANLAEIRKHLPPLLGLSASGAR